MALVLIGKTPCVICGQPIEKDDRVEAFPPFVWNEADALWPFNDAAVHVACLETHPLRPALKEAMDERSRKMGPDKRKCLVCNETIQTPEDFFLIPWLTGDPSNPLKRFNYTKLHVSHVPLWKDVEEYRRLLNEAAQSGTWKGIGLQALRDILAAATGGPPFAPPKVMRRND